MRTIASVGSWMVGSGDVSTRTSRLPCQVTAFIARLRPTPVRQLADAQRPAGARGERRRVETGRLAHALEQLERARPSRETRGVQPSCSRARRVSITGTAEPHVQPARRRRAAAARARWRPRARAAPAPGTRTARARDPRERRRIEHRLGGDVVGAARVLARAPRAGRPRRRRRRARTAAPAGRAAAAPGAGRAAAAAAGSSGPANSRRISGPASRLKISPGRRRTTRSVRVRAPRPRRARARPPPCGASRTSVAMPSRGHDSSTARSFGPGRVDADRRRVHERRHARLGGRLEHAPRAVRRSRARARRSSRLGWISHARWITASAPANSGPQVVARDVGRDPARARRCPRRQAAGDADDLVHAVVPGRAPRARSCPRCRSRR